MADHAMCLVGVTLSFSWFISALALLVFWTDDDTSLRPRPFLLDGLFNYVLSRTDRETATAYEPRTRHEAVS
ncbi:hypothetical protein QL093DRAFT_2147002 [Fusarium oxysporum]|nr:hypothetical protein QL093DRAFT_2147002 [Fusarium oxysporum]